MALLGLLLCKGDTGDKAAVMYEILNGQDQTFISSFDDDFVITFSLLFSVATKGYKEFKLKAFSDFMCNEWLDGVFLNDGKLTRAEFVKRVTVRDEANWIFNLEEIRERALKYQEN